MSRICHDGYKPIAIVYIVITSSTLNPMQKRFAEMLTEHIKNHYMILPSDDISVFGYTEVCTIMNNPRIE